jgi:hypothetical protein
MWGLWFVPLVVLLILVATASGLLWFFVSPKNRRPKITTVVAIPIGCAAILIIGLPLLAAFGSLFVKSDAQLYEEIFGYRPTLTEDRMLFDDFGGGSDREIFMRAEPTDAERKKLLTIAGSVESSFTLDQFIARGAQHGFMWWMSANSREDGYCKSARILDAPGFRGWIEFRIAECLDAGTEFPASANAGKVYVIASHRTE